MDFQTINSTGLKLSAFDICVAKFMRYGLDYNIKEKVKNAKRNDKNIEIALADEETIILQTIALLAGKTVKKSKLADELNKADIDNYWDMAIRGISEAINVLDDFGVGAKKDLSILPYHFYIADMKVGVGSEKEASQLHHIFQIDNMVMLSQLYK